MSPIRKARLACCLGLILTGVGCNDPSKSEKSGSLSLTSVGPEPVTSVLRVGVWGGNQIQLFIQNNGGGAFTFNCGTGGTQLPIVPDENGHFDLTGSYTSFQDPNNPSSTDIPTQDVIFHGDVSGDTINIDVEFPNGDAPSGAPMNGFSVMYGTPSDVMECQI